MDFELDKLSRERNEKRVPRERKQKHQQRQMYFPFIVWPPRIGFAFPNALRVELGSKRRRKGSPTTVTTEPSSCRKCKLIEGLPNCPCRRSVGC